MRALILPTVLLFTFFAPSARAIAKVHEPKIKFLSASAPSVGPLEGLLLNEPTRFQTPQKNFKLSIVFDHPLAISKVSLQSCAKEWSDGIQIFSAPGLGRTFVEGGKDKFEAKIDSHDAVESIAIVFGHDSDLCLENLKFFDAKNELIALANTPSAPAKSTGGQVNVLFDAHPETQIALEDPVSMTFDESQTFDRAIVWTGGGPFYAHVLKLKGEKGWSETLPIRRSAADQEVIFKRPFTGKQLSITAPDAGEIGELRFALGTKVESVQLSLANRLDVKKKFEDANFLRTLDFDWVSAATDDDKWIFIFRQDGTFFIRGFNDDQHQARDYSALGSFTIVRAEKNKLRLRLNGVRFPSGAAWDGVSCPLSCGGDKAVDNTMAITDSLVLEKGDDGSMMVRNRTPRAARTMTVGDLKIHRSVDD